MELHCCTKLDFAFGKKRGNFHRLCAPTDCAVHNSCWFILKTNYFGNKINFIDLKHSRHFIQHKCNYTLHINLPPAPVLSQKNTILFISLYISSVTSFHLDKICIWILEGDPLITYNERIPTAKLTCKVGLRISFHSFESKNTDSTL